MAAFALIALATLAMLLLIGSERPVSDCTPRRLVVLTIAAIGNTAALFTLFQLLGAFA